MLYQRVSSSGFPRSSNPHWRLLGWRVDSNRQHQETISAVRATANEQVPYNVQGVRISDFSIPLSS